MIDCITNGSDIEMEYSSNSDSLLDECVSSSDLIYQQQSASGCTQTKYKDFPGYL